MRSLRHISGLSTTRFQARLTLEALASRSSPSSLFDVFSPVLQPPADTSSQVVPNEVWLASAESQASPDVTLSPATRGEDESELVFLLNGKSAAPRIVNFTAIEVVGGLWRFTGDVVDVAPGGLTIKFGGEPVSLGGKTATTDANGHFDKAFLMNTDGSDNGLASAQTADAQGHQSNVALYNITPG